MSANDKQKKYNILVLCTGNSARSIMVEALFNTVASKYFQAFSAGSHPTGKVNPYAIEQIDELLLDFEPRSKSWDEFSRQDSPDLDLVLTVCGNAAQEICPKFIGNPKHVHWGVPDPAAERGSNDDKRNAFEFCFKLFNKQITDLITILEQDQKNDLDSLLPLMVKLAP